MLSLLARALTSCYPTKLQCARDRSPRCVRCIGARCSFYCESDGVRRDIAHCYSECAHHESGFFHNRYLAVCVSVFRRIGFVEVSFLLLEAHLFDADVLNVVLSGILDIVRKIDVK
jgi:hypothetical protein